MNGGGGVELPLNSSVSVVESSQIDVFNQKESWLHTKQVTVYYIIRHLDDRVTKALLWCSNGKFEGYSWERLSVRELHH